MRNRLMWGTLILFVAVLFAGIGTSNAQDVKRISKESLNKILGDPNVIVVDVRLPYDWNDSKLKIKGAKREDPFGVKDWMKKYQKDKTLVFYCA
jgi:rhodanese-related sulfurtransferase